MAADSISAEKVKAMRAAFEEAVNSIRSASTLKAVQDAIAAGDVDRLIRILGLDETTFAPLTEALRDSYLTGGQFAADILTPIPTVDGPVVFRFDLTATSAAQWIATESSRLIVEILDDQREMVRTVIAEGTQAGIGPRQQALDLIGRVGADGVRRGGFIGLTNQQADWVNNARRDLQLITATPEEIAEWFRSRGLVQPENYSPARSYMGRALRDKRFDAAIRRAIKDGKPVPKQTIDAAITAMQSRAQKYRGDTIARTEAIRGLRAGQAEGLAQAISKGDIDPGDVTKEWDATGDGRTRETHQTMEDQLRRLYEPFDFPLGGQAMYPGDDSLNAPAGELIQCFVPETPIAVSGLKSAITRHYSGNVIKIRAGLGVNLTVTPNHPILTDRGWIPAGGVVNGDKVVDCSGWDGFFSSKPDVADIVSSAEQLYKAAESLGSVDRVVRGIVNLHGEIPDSDVDVVSIESKLADSLNSPLAEFCNYFSLSETDVSLVGLVFNRIKASCNIASTNDSGNLISSRRTRPSFVRAGECSGHGISFANTGTLKTKVIEAGINNMPGNSKLFGYSIDWVSYAKKARYISMESLSSFGVSGYRLMRNGLERFISGNRLDLKVCETGLYDANANAKLFGYGLYRKMAKALNRAKVFFSGYFMRIKRGSCSVDSSVDKHGSSLRLADAKPPLDVESRMASHVKGFDFVEVDSVSVSHYDGPVYNFETESGIIVSGNTISHNCRCRVVYRVDFIGRAIRMEGFR